MRLSRDEAGFILATFKQYQPEADIYLHGSRVHDEKKGGDIDLLIVCQDPIAKTKLSKQREEILVLLKDKLGDQRIDLTIADKDSLSGDVIYQSMLRAAIKL